MPEVDFWESTQTKCTISVLAVSSVATAAARATNIAELPGRPRLAQ
jgi:hypothetical protein